MTERSSELPRLFQSFASRGMLGALLLLAGCSDLLSDGYDYGEIEVQAVRRSGEPVPGVELVLYSWERPLAYGTTGPDGRFVFDFVPEGQFGVRAVPQGDYVPVVYDFPSVAHDGVRVAGSREAISFTFLKLGAGAVDVVVRNPSGAPVPDAEVELYTFRGAAARGRTDGSGRHTFQSIPFGNYGVRVYAPRGFVIADGQGSRDDVLVDEGSRESIALALDPCTGRIRVRATDPQGRPVVGARFALYDFRGVLSEGETDAGGAYEFVSVPCGNFGVSAQPLLGFVTAPGRGGSYVDDIQIANESEPSFSFVFRPCTGRIRARVADRSGAPVPGARVTLYSFRGTIAARVADAGGAAEFDTAPCGDLGVKVEPPSGFSVTEGRGSSFFDGIAVEDGTDREVSFSVSRS